MSLTITAISGNPRAGSRTITLAATVAGRLAHRLGTEEAAVVDLATLAPQLYAPQRPDVDDALARVAGSRLLVVATPVYKASYTGLLKSFLDLYGANALRGVTALPLIVGASPTHLLAAELHLRPLLVELGASVPTRGFGVTEAELPLADEAVDAWLTEHAGPLLAAVQVDAAVPA